MCPRLSYTWYEYKLGDLYYNTSDGKTTLDANDDIATRYWGAPCRMPDSSEFSELYNQCDWSWKSNYNGTSGYLVTGPNGNTIFFPASGYRDYHDLIGHGSCGYYWSRSLYSNDTKLALCLYFCSDHVDPAVSFERYRGLTVRPVAEK